ncbi:MAG TPA: hypothetical protein VM577_19355 [Anaerovoracaceae bacterium]|nr:hypothetical protein [Anaerovoracaceae bacterium]
MCKWNDAHGSSGTLADHEIEHKPYVYTTVGFKVRTDDIGVSIAFEQGEDGRWRDITFVPRAMVIEEYSLGELKKPRAKRKAAHRGMQEKESTEGETHLA